MNDYDTFKISNIINIRKKIWKKVPEEVRRAKNRNGLMQPLGSIVYAESETRNLQQLLWVFKNLLKEKQITINNLKNSLKAFLEHFSVTIGGWCSLTDTSALLKDTSELISKLETSEDLDDIIDELMLYIGRVNMWLDLLIPWDDLNEQIKKNLKSFYID